MFADHDVNRGRLRADPGPCRFVSRHECRVVSGLPASVVGVVLTRRPRGPATWLPQLDADFSLRIWHLNYGDSANPGAFRVYLQAAAPQLSALQRNHGQTESSRPDRHELPHTAP
jgi:hypothetical protein